MPSPCPRWSVLLVVPLFSFVTANDARGQDPQAPPNLLVDISREFIANVVEQSIERTDPVADVILKTHISGTGRTVAKVAVELVPNDQMGVADLLTTGTTYASTVGLHGPVQIYSDSTIPFQIRQRVYFRPEGIGSDDPQSHAEGDSTLTGITTNFHCLLDRLVKRIACNQYRKSKDKAEAIGMRHAEAQLNESARAEAASKLQEADKSLKKNLADLRAQGISAAIRFSTSRDTFHVRVNVQEPGLPPVGAPPPLPGRPYLALRVHESMINESARVSLAGKTLTGEDFEKEAKKLGQMDTPMPKDDKEFSITFAKDRPLDVTFAGQDVQAVIRLVEFTSGDDAYSGMNMTIKYKLVPAGDKIKAVRQGPIEAFPPNFKPGQKLNGRQQAMRTVLQKRFGKFFKEEMVLENVELTGDLKKAGPLVATRAEAERGWLLMTWRKE